MGFATRSRPPAASLCSGVDVIDLGLHARAGADSVGLDREPAAAGEARLRLRHGGLGAVDGAAARGGRALLAVLLRGRRLDLRGLGEPRLGRGRTPDLLVHLLLLAPLAARAAGEQEVQDTDGPRADARDLGHQPPGPAALLDAAPHGVAPEPQVGHRQGQAVGREAPEAPAHRGREGLQLQRQAEGGQQRAGGRLAGPVRRLPEVARGELPLAQRRAREHGHALEGEGHADQDAQHLDGHPEGPHARPAAARGGHGGP
mmetsp:Transcript_55029/g.170421  ORF Transcript_55029/g.170421 Transcript_55029/m.170421 type:complete len:259 (-) Transcript_55029:51-827(-)